MECEKRLFLSLYPSQLSSRHLLQPCLDRSVLGVIMGASAHVMVHVCRQRAVMSTEGEQQQSLQPNLSFEGIWLFIDTASAHCATRTIMMVLSTMAEGRPPPPPQRSFGVSLVGGASGSRAFALATQPPGVAHVLLGCRASVGQEVAALLRLHACSGTPRADRTPSVPVIFISRQSTGI